jgi:hypothetical protein
LNRIPFAKIVVILASIFGIALGLCGLDLVLAASKVNTLGPVFAFAAVVAAALMALSGIGLVITFILWAIASATDSRSPRN